MSATANLVDHRPTDTANTPRAARAYEGVAVVLGVQIVNGGGRYTVAQGNHGLSKFQAIYRELTGDLNFLPAIAEEGKLAIGIVVDVPAVDRFIYAAPKASIIFPAPTNYNTGQIEEAGHPWGLVPESLWLSDSTPGEITTVGPTLQWLGGVVDHSRINFGA